MLWRRRILPLNYRSPPKTRPWLRLWTREHLSQRTTSSHQFQALPAIQQRPTMRKEKFNIKFWCKHGKLRRSGDLWTGGLLSPVAAKADPWHRNRPLQRDGLAVLNQTPRQIEKAKKQICQIFANNNLKITVDANKKVVNFLDVTLDLKTGKLNHTRNHPPPRFTFTANRITQPTSSETCP